MPQMGGLNGQQVSASQLPPCAILDRGFTWRPVTLCVDQAVLHTCACKAQCRISLGLLKDVSFGGTFIFAQLIQIYI